MRRPVNRMPAVHPGQILREDFLVPLGMSVNALSIELAQASEKAKSRKLTLEEMDGGSFTITNLGGIGGTGFSPIVNHPEVAILGVSKASMKPVWIFPDRWPSG